MANPTMDNPTYAGSGGARARLRLGVICPTLYPGGAEQATLETLKCLDADRFQVVGTVSTSPHLRSPLVVQNYEKIAPVSFGQDEASRLAARCDVILCWAVEIGLFLPRGGKRPAVVMVSHSTADMEWANTIQRMAAPHVDVFVAVSRAALSSIPATHRSKAQIIPHALDQSRVEATKSREEVLRSWGIDPGRTVIGYVGRLAEEKRTILFPDVIASLPAQFVGVMVGIGSEERAVKVRAAAVARGRVFFPGAMSEIGNALNTFARFLHLALYESFCLAIAEAMLASVPVIATPVGFLKEYAGIAKLVPFRASPGAISLSILEDLNNADQSADRAAIAKRLIREVFNRRHFQKSWESAITSAAEDGPGGRRRSPGVADQSGSGSRLTMSQPTTFATSVSNRVRPSDFRATRDVGRPPRPPQSNPRKLLPSELLQILSCTFRGDVAPGTFLFGCAHPQVHSSNGVVDGDVCVVCVHRQPRTERLGSRNAFLATGERVPCSDWAVGVRAVSRNPRALERHLASLKTEGWKEPRVFLPPGIEVQDTQRALSVTIRDSPLEPVKEWFLALSELFMRKPRADAYLLCDDDLLISPGLGHYLASSLWPAAEVGVISLVGPAAFPGNNNSGFHLWRYGQEPTESSAYIIPNRSARSLISDQLLLTHRQGSFGGLAKTIDVLLANWCARSGHPYFFHNPCLARRIKDDPAPRIGPANEA